MKSPVGCASYSKYSKYSKNYWIIKLFKNAAKLDDGRIWNCSRIMRIRKRNGNFENVPDRQHEDMSDSGSVRQRKVHAPVHPQTRDMKQPTWMSTRSHKGT